MSVSCLTWLLIVAVIGLQAKLSTNKFELTTDMKRAILDAHNEYRSNVALGNTGRDHPTASNMNQLFWDRCLELIASNYSTHCSFYHNTKRSRWVDLCLGQDAPKFATKRYNAVGENIYVTSANHIWRSVSVLKRGVQRWYAEHKGWDETNQKCSKYPCGHYKQVVWAQSRYVGCAYYECKGPIQGLSYWSYNNGATVMICNYYLAGNWWGKPTYKQGNACDSCDGDRSYCENGLCAGCMSPSYTINGNKSATDCDDGTGRSVHHSTNNPTDQPSNIPTKEPSDYPSIVPTYNPSTLPTTFPTEEEAITTTMEYIEPTLEPTRPKTTSNAPTVEPTIEPTMEPTVEPTF